MRWPKTEGRQLDEDVGLLRSIPDPVERARRATELVARYQTAVLEFARVRREAIDELRTAGLSQGDIAKALGLTRSRVGQLEGSGPPPERAFFGVDTLTVAVALKEEAGKAKPAPVVAQEDFDAANRMKELVRGLQLSTRFEHIAPPGNVHLNRPNLVVICGPRMSPLVAQVLESDPNLAFGVDDAGWHLVDRRSGTTYRSPMDSGVPGDFAYLGRLPRPDGRGTFLYIAGIHAMGAHGVVHFLEGHLGELYREVRDRRFSTLVGCEFDPATRQVTASQRLTPVYRPDA